MLTNITVDKIIQYDKFDMHKIYDQWPSIAAESYSSNLESVDYSNIDNIVLSGMGGSGTLADLLASILSKTKIHTTVVKGYELPKTVDDSTLVVVCSVSGNTDETLSVLKSANQLKSNLVVFSSGGMMETFCTKQNIDFRKLTMTHSPRASLPKFLYSMLNVLGPILPIEKSDILESIDELEKLREMISTKNLSENNSSLNLARSITTTPTIFYPYGFQSAAIRFKNSLQENAKIPVIIEDVIEACHNNIESWSDNTQSLPILIRGNHDHKKTLERWDILKEFFQTNNIPYKEIFSGDGHVLTKLMSLIYRLDFASIYLALLSKIDPGPIPAIDFVKTRLNSEF